MNNKLSFRAFTIDLSRLRHALLITLTIALPSALPFVLSSSLIAQTPTIVGYPSNFDAYNNTGGPVHGFEIEAHGIDQTQVTRVFGGSTPNCYIRYCTGTIIPFPGGVKIRYASPYDPATQTFAQTTGLPTGVVGFGESCWTLGLGVRYSNAGCEHFGISTTVNPTAVIYRWLVEDPANPGKLVYFTGTNVNVPNAPPVPVYLPQPVINVIAPAVAGGAPIVEFNINMPAPPPAPVFEPVPQLGDAQWVKVYKLELDHQVDLNDLMGGNAAVPEAPMPAETEWQLMQYDPSSHSKRNALKSRGGLGNGNESVVRRYEHYKYTGAYSAFDHAAVCGGDGLCTAPLAGEFGDPIGAQNAAANLIVPSLTVTSIGGTVTSLDAIINCGQTCFANYSLGTQISLTAVASKTAVFSSWNGACTGPQPTCNLTANDALKVTANYTPIFSLQVSLGGKGLVTGSPSGENVSINCGRDCSANFQKGTTVTLTASQNTTQKFIGWTGSCSGTSTICTVTVNAAMKVQANFK